MDKQLGLLDTVLSSAVTGYLGMVSANLFGAGEALAACSCVTMAAASAVTTVQSLTGKFGRALDIARNSMGTVGTGLASAICFQQDRPALCAVFGVAAFGIATLNAVQIYNGLKAPEI